MNYFDIKTPHFHRAVLFSSISLQSLRTIRARHSQYERSYVNAVLEYAKRLKKLIEENKTAPVEMGGF